MSINIPIYEFSRAFDNPHYSQTYQQWVSGGYSAERVAHWSKEVPAEIVSSIKEGHFAINDNYPPQSGDIALIAREIAQYAVLAVANRQMDDAGRPTIGYRYFWLDSNELDYDAAPARTGIDGVETLLNWWESKERPEFSMEAVASGVRPSIDYHKASYRFDLWDTVGFTEITDYVAAVSQIPVVEIAQKSNWREYPEYLKLHWQTFGINLRCENCKLAWAWNVRRLQNPTSFLCIYYAYDGESSAIVAASKKQLPSKPIHQGLHSQDKKHNSGSIANQSVSSKIVPTEKIKKCMLNLARSFANQQQVTDPNRGSELFKYLMDYPNEDWETFVDERALQGSSPLNEAYRALIYIIIPRKKSSWLLQFLTSLQPEASTNPLSSINLLHLLGFSDPSPENLALNLHRELLSLTASKGEVRTRLKTSIYIGISYLLTRLLEEKLSKQELQQLRYLLTESNSVWSECFRTYARYSYQKIVSYSSSPHQEHLDIPETISAFCEELVSSINSINRVPRRNRKKDYRKYRNLAFLFKQVDQLNVSDWLCGLETGRTLMPARNYGFNTVRSDKSTRNQSSQNNKPLNIDSLTHETQQNSTEVSNSTSEEVSESGPSSERPSSEHPYPDQGKALFCFALFFLALLVATFFIKLNDSFFALLLYVPLIFSIIFVLCTDSSYRTSFRGKFIYSIFFVVLAVVAFPLLHIPFWSSQSQEASPPITTRFTQCYQSSIDDWQSFRYCDSYDRITQDRYIQNIFLPDSANSYADRQVEMIREYLKESRSGGDFFERRRKVEDCRDVHIRSSGDFGTCLKALPDYPRSSPTQ